MQKKEFIRKNRGHTEFTTALKARFFHDKKWIFNFSSQKLKKYNVTGSYIFGAKFKRLILQVNVKTKIYVWHVHAKDYICMVKVK